MWCNGVLIDVKISVMCLQFIHTYVHSLYFPLFVHLQRGGTPFHIAAETDSKECMKLLVHQYGMDPDIRDFVS